MRIITGIRPRGVLHIGNYLNTVKQYVELQKENECIFFIADLHGLTTSYNPKKYRREVFEKAIDILAAGLDPQKCIIYIQSDVQESTELAWLLSTVTPVGDLRRMTQFKEKSKKEPQNINAGLLNYPVLMAADILLYKPDIIPVGKDQHQHIELARTVARKFNHQFGETFKVPKPFTLKQSAKIMSLQEPKKKMSKSDPEPTRLSIFDEPEAVRKKIMSAVTDTGKRIEYNLTKKPGISNLLTIYSLFGEKTINQLEREFKGKGYSDFKKSLAKTLNESFNSFREKRKELLAREEYVREVLEQGAKKAKALAEYTLSDAKKKMGLA